MSIEANLSSHLSISYSAPAAANGSASAAVAGNAAASAGNGASGFLSQLIDQLLARAAIQPGAVAATATSGDSTAAPPADGPFKLDLSQPEPVPLKTVVLFGQLSKALKAVKAELDAGQKPSDDELKRLGNTVDALAALINAPSPKAAGITPAAAQLDPLQALVNSGAPGVSDNNKPDKSQHPVADQLNQLLVAFGLTPPQQPTGAAAQAPADANSAAVAQVQAPTSPQALPALAQLADQLAEIGSAVAAASPEVAQKLDALSQKLAAAETDPATALTQLTSAGDSGGSDLDQLVKQLLDAKPAPASTPATPQLASTTKLDIPAPIAPQPPVPVAGDQPAALAPATVAPGTSKPAITTSVASPTSSNDQTGPGDKLAAKAVAAADVAKSDVPDNASSPQSQAAAAPLASVSPRALPAAYQAASSPINMGQVAFELVRQVHQGTTRFSFRLDPPELGRVDVKMHVDASGTLNARLTVERSETLDMFQRDRGALEKALGQAGLDSGKTNLEFSLKQNQQNPFAGLSGGDQRPGGNGSPQFSLARSADDGEDAGAAVPSITLYRGVASAGGVNLFV